MCEDGSRFRRVVFLLSSLVTPDGRDRQALFHYLDRDGIELYVRTSLDRTGARDALRQRGLLRYIDGLLYEDDEDPPAALRVSETDECRYSWIAERCIREDRRPFPLVLEAF